MSDYKEGDELIRQMDELDEKRAAEPPPELTNDVVANLASLSPLQYAQQLGRTAKEYKTPMRLLEKAVDAARAKIKAESTQSTEIDADRARAAAGDLVACPDILGRFGEEITAGAGLVGETDNAKILYLAGISRLFERPLSVVVKGVSSGGKSYTVERTLAFFSSTSYLALTAGSEKSLFFLDENLSHRCLVLYEAAGLGHDRAAAQPNPFAYAIRTLLSEGRLKYAVSRKSDDGDIRTVIIEKEGPTGLITTTTAAKLHPENETRMLSLGVIDTAEQTKAVMQALARGAKDSNNYAPWHALQDWLATGERRVEVPFAKALADAIPPLAVRLRRDFGALLCLIRAHALLHRETRKRDHQGRIVATVGDYGAVYHLVARLFAEGIEATVPTIVRQTVAAVEAYLTKQKATAITLTQLARELELDKNSVHHRLRKAYAAGYLVNQEDRRGKPARIALGEPLPAESGILPDPGSLERQLGELRSGENIDLHPREFTPTLQQSGKILAEARACTVGASVEAGSNGSPTVLGVGAATIGSNRPLQQSKPLVFQEKMTTVGVLERFPGDEGHPLARDKYGRLVLRGTDGLEIPTAMLRCFYCNKPGAEPWDLNGRTINLHPGCQQSWAEEQERPTTNAQLSS